MKPEALTWLYRYTTITNSLRLSRVSLQEGSICRLPFHLSGCHRRAYAAARPLTELYGRTDGKPQIERLCACYITGGECRYLLIFSGHCRNVYLNVYEDDALYHNLDIFSFAIPLFAWSSRHSSQVPFQLQSTWAHKRHCPNPSRH